MNPISTLLRANAAFWTEDRSLTALLGYLLINVFVVPPLAPSHFGEIMNAMIFSMILVSGVFAVAAKAHLKVFIVILSSLTILVHWFSLANKSINLTVLDIALSMISWAALTSLVLWHVFKEGHVSFHRIQGAVAVYVLIGLIWSSAYHLVYLYDPLGFIFPSFQNPDEKIYIRFIYFSYETLTTLGIGDIVPVNPVAKSLTMVEGLIGQLFPAIMITRLVSLEIESRKKRMS